MASIVAIGEILVEMMASPGQTLSVPGSFAGPFPSGAPAIFIDQAARLGASAAIIGCVGADGFGNCVIDRLTGDGVDVSAVRRLADAATGVAFVAYRGDGRRDFIFHLEHAAAGRLGPDDVPEAAFAGCRVLHLMGSSLGAPRMADAIARGWALARAAGAVLSFDPNVRPELLGRPGTADRIRGFARQAHWLLPSEADLAFLCPAATAGDAARGFLDGAARCVFLKRGAAGSTVHTADDAVDIAPFPADEVDPTGAGDCAGATFVVSLLDGLAPVAAARRANAAGALAVGRRGPMEGNSTPAMLDAMLAA